MQKKVWLFSNVMQVTQSHSEFLVNFQTQETARFAKMNFFKCSMKTPSKSLPSPQLWRVHTSYLAQWGEVQNKECTVYIPCKIGHNTLILMQCQINNVANCHSHTHHSCNPWPREDFHGSHYYEIIAFMPKSNFNW